jgi:nucleoside 2-deoxyribosyltransferase
MQSKRIYVAGPWLDRFNAANVAQVFEERGHTITHKWWLYEGEGEHKESEEFMQNCAKLDLDGVKHADVVVVLNTYKSEGKAVEQGIAIGYGIPIILITPGERPSANIFHHLPCYKHVQTVQQALEAI